MLKSVVRGACLLGTTATLLLASSSAQALTCPKCYCQPRLCNWATYGYYPTEWRPWPSAIVHAPPTLPPSSVLPAQPMVHPTTPLPYRMSPTKPGDVRQGAEDLKMPLPVKPK